MEDAACTDPTVKKMSKRALPQTQEIATPMTGIKAPNLPSAKEDI